jgi:hypothetical protein
MGASATQPRENPSGFRLPYTDDAVEWRDRQPVTASCALCDWTMDGLAGEVLPAQVQHRAEAHGVVVKKRARRGRPAKAPVQRAIEKAHRAQDAAELVQVLVPPTQPVRLDHCGFCGSPVVGGNVCRSHADLLEAGL